MHKNARFNAYFFKSAAGNEPVREWIRSLNDVDKRIIGKDVMKVEIGGPQIGKPTVDGLGDDLYEIRSTIADGRIEARILFTVVGNTILLLHGFCKTTRKTPIREIRLARERMKEAKRTDQP